MVRTRIFSRPLVGLACLLALSVFVGFLVFARFQQARDTRAWVEHTNEVLGTIGNLTKDMYAAESAHRGFVVASLDRQLSEFNHLTAPDGPIYTELAHLRVLTKDNPSQQHNLDSLDDAVRQRVDFMAETVRIYQVHDTSGMQERLKTGAGPDLMDRAIAAADTMADAERSLLSERTRTDHRTDNINMAISMISTILLLLVIVAAYFSIQREFNRRRLVERALRETGELNRKIFDHSFYPIIAIGADGIVTSFNAAAERMLGYKAEEVIGIHTPRLWHEQFNNANPGTKPGATQIPPVDALREEGRQENEWVFVRKDGGRIDVKLSVTELRDADGKLTGYMGIGQDITERKHIEQMKNEFISTVSHELRTPLTSIRGSLGLVVGNAAGEIPDKAAALVQIAYKNTERLVRLINNILDIEKLEAGRMLFASQPIDVSTVLQQAVEMNAGLAQGRGIKLRVENHADGVQAFGDQDRLMQVLSNLLSNAIKFSGDNASVMLAAHRDTAGVRLEVIDTGPGIPDTFKPHIFGRFAQAPAEDGHQKTGSGLGLSISKEIMEKMGGSIGFQSRPGYTLFHIILPEAGAMAAISPLPDAVHGKRILVCEDDPDIASLLRFNFEKQGYDCVVASTAAGAKALLKQTNFAAMTLDLGLPDQDGMSLIRELRSKPETVHLPIVIISAHSRAEKRMEGMAVEVSDWLVKPIDLPRLNKVMQGVVPAARMAHILHIEDDPDIVEVLATSMRDAAHFTRAANLKHARQLLASTTFDLALLDIFLPDGNGLDLLPELAQQEPPVPVIILSVSETSDDIKAKVEASLVKSVVSEEKVIATVKSYIDRRGGDHGGA